MVGWRRLLIGLSGVITMTMSDGLARVGSAAGLGIDYPMSADVWAMMPPMTAMGDVAGVARFARYEGMPTGTMTLNEGVAELKTARFSEGAIDFDMKPLGYDDAGVIFHSSGTTDGEFFYLRANPDCPAADDCIQYAPITHSMMAWNVYANYQGPAPISPTGWNHVHIVVAGERMAAYINHSARPLLVVPQLRGLLHEGGIAFKGPAVYANLSIDPDNRGDLQAARSKPVEPGTVTTWLSAPPTVYGPGRPVSVTDAESGHAWRRIDVEATGLINLGREFGMAKAPLLSLGWLKTTLDAATDMRRTLKVGFAEQLWVFLDGRLIHTGENQYFPSGTRLSPDGRLEPDNATIALDLRKGTHVIVLAVANDWRSHAGALEPSPYGWAAEAHFSDMSGLRLH